MLCCLPLCIFAVNRSDRLKPIWLTTTTPAPTSDSYFLVTAHGQAGSLEAARHAAINHLSMRLEDEHQYTFDVHVISNTQTQVLSSHKNIDVSGERVTNTRSELRERDKKLVITFRSIDEYWKEKNGIYEVDILFAVSNPNSYNPGIFDNITTTTKYGAAGLLSIIPGAGQMYKGDMAKGISFLVVDVACASGIVLCECTRAAYAAKITQQPQYAQQYSTRANNWSTGRNICIGVTAGIWLWNIIDAFAAKGARRVVVKPNKGYVTMTPSYQVNPITNTTDQGFGIAYHF